MKPIFLGILLFVAAPLQGHVHVQVGWNNNTFTLEVLDFTFGRFPSHQYTFGAGQAALRRVPPDDRFAFLGEAGSSVWILPQNEDPALPYLGIGADNTIPNGLLMGNKFELVLLAVDGPGHLFVYQTSPFGPPDIWFNSAEPADGIRQARELSRGAHIHQNWAFTAPGFYLVTFQVQATRASDGEPIQSEPATFRFRFHPPPPPHASLRREGDEVTLRIESRAGARLRILSSTDLRNWESSPAFLLDTPTFSQTVETDLPKKFWKVREVFDNDDLTD